MIQRIDADALAILTAVDRIVVHLVEVEVVVAVSVAHEIDVVEGLALHVAAIADDIYFVGFFFLYQGQPLVQGSRSSFALMMAIADRFGD